MGGAILRVCRLQSGVSLCARAAFWVATAPASGSGPSPEGCQSCGVATHGWCEGCYSRVGYGGAFSAVCRDCDQQHIVCPDCVEAGVSWDIGHQRYEDQHGPEDDQTLEVTIDEDRPPIRINIAELAASAGISSEQARAELFRALGVSPTPGS